MYTKWLTTQINLYANMTSDPSKHENLVLPLKEYKTSLGEHAVFSDLLH
jgi:hypothetical protein